MYRHKKIVKLELEVYARLTWSLFSRNCREQNDGCDRVSVMTDLNTPHKTKDIFGFEDNVACQLRPSGNQALIKLKVI